jgi:phosphoribosyl-ATP pyrophosphohydrolase/phosphoribosyl-AMP cyclohydrolase
MCVKPEKLKYGKDGLLPMIVQDAEGGAVLSLFYANEESIRKMLKEGYVWRYSRKLGRVIKKGEESGNFQKVVEVKVDCDSDTLLVRVEPEGPACHTGEYSCFGVGKPLLEELVAVIADRKKNPKEGSYTSGLVGDREAVVAKLREELDELIEAEKDSEVAWEAADLIYFTLVYLENREVPFSRVIKELEGRRR